MNVALIQEALEYQEAHSLQGPLFPEAQDELAQLVEQLKQADEAYEAIRVHNKARMDLIDELQEALRDLLKETEPRDHKWAVQGGTRPGDCVFCRAHVALGTVPWGPDHPSYDEMGQ